MFTSQITIERRSWEAAERMLRRVSRNLHPAERAVFDALADEAGSEISECWQFDTEGGA